MFDERRLLLKGSKKRAMMRLNEYQDDAALGLQEQQARGIKIAQTGGKPSPPALAGRIGATRRGAQQEYGVRVLGKETVCRYL